MDPNKSPELDKASEIAKQIVDPSQNINSSTTANSSNAGLNNNSNESPNKLKKINKWFLILGVVLVLPFSLLGWYILNSQQKKNSSTEEKKSIQENSIDPSSYETDIKKVEQPATGEVWYSARKELPNLKFFSTEDESYNTAQYYEIGTRGDNKIILVITQTLFEADFLFEKTPDGKYQHITFPNKNAYEKSIPPKSVYTFINVENNSTQHYDSLSYPKYIEIGNEERVILSNSSVGRTESITNSKHPKKLIRKIGASSLYQTKYTYVDTGLTSIYYKMLTPIGTEIDYSYGPAEPKDVKFYDEEIIPPEENSSSFKWDNGVVSTDGIKGVASGCSLGNSMTIAENLTDSDFVKAGVTKSGKNLYDFKDVNNTIFKKALQESNDSIGQGGSRIEAIGPDEFLKQHGVFAYKSPNNGWLIYSRNEYGPSYGCAKPVVYLYPEKPQSIKVKVGAQVKISEPEYDTSKGWTAFAQPNGQLTVEGKKYGSLFWEGNGYGEYPSITSGTVVKRSDAEKTIRANLAQLGLNAQETKDFMDFWTAKIPDSPYVRLTWFNTQEMERLAPLYISPEPDTLIRVFLDMTGYDNYINIPTQKLSSTPRKGFTVVEWGGLAAE